MRRNRPSEALAFYRGGSQAADRRCAREGAGVDRLSTAASVIQVGTFLADVLGRIRRAVAGDPVANEINRVLDDSLTSALHESGLALGAQDAAFEQLREIFLRLGAQALGELVVAGSAPVEFDEILDNAPTLGGTLKRFTETFRSELLRLAAQPGSPLFQQTVLEHLSSLVDRVNAIYEAVQVHRADLDVERFPHSVATALTDEAMPTEVGRKLTRWLANVDTREANLRDLVGRPPDWMEAGGARSWTVVAELAAAHGHADVERAAYLNASRLDERPSYRFLYRVRAAGIAPDALAQLAAIRQENTDPASRAFVDCMAALVVQDHDAIWENLESAMGLNSDCDVTLLNFKAQILGGRGDFDGAIEIWRRIAGPKHTGMRLLLAQALTIRATKDVAADRLADAQEALQIAQEAIVDRRRWGGNSAEAVLAAVQAAAAMEDWAAVIRVGSVEHGDATPEEASGEGVAELVGFAQLVSDHASAPTGGGSPSGQAWLRGMVLNRDPANRSDAIAAFSDAVDAADGSLELERALRGLAVLGVYPLPRLDELRTDEPDHAAALDAIARYRSMGAAAPEAVADLRRLASRARLAAGFLVAIYLDRGDSSLAADLAIDAARRFDEPSMYVMAAEALTSSDPERADEIARDALDRLPVGAPTRAALRRVRVGLATLSGDADRVLLAAQAAIDEGLNDPRLNWLMVEAHLAANQPAKAWGFIDANSLTPNTEHQASLFLLAHARAAPQSSMKDIDVLDAFQSSHDVLAQGLVLALTIDRPNEEASDPPPHDEAILLAERQRRYGEHLQRFTIEFPDSPALWSITVDPESPESIIAALEAEMPELDPDAEAAIEVLWHHLDAGLAPVGAVTSALRRDPLPTMCIGQNRSVPTLPTVFRLAAEVDAAQAALGRPVVVDFSTLAALSMAPESWEHVQASAGRLSMVSSQRLEIDQFNEVTIPAGHSIRTPAGIRFSELDENERGAIRARSKWMADTAASLPQEVPVLVEQGHASMGDVEARGSWAHALRFAKAHGRPLLCDDPALAELARSEGVTAFGSYALMLAAAGTGIVSPEAMSAHLRACYRRRMVDIPVPSSVLVAIAEDTEWEVEPFTSAIARPGFWQQPSAAAALSRVADAILNSGHAGAREQLAALTAATVRGASRAVPPMAAPGFTALTLVQLLVSARVDASEFPTLVGAVRLAWEGPDDLLPTFLTTLLETLEDAHDAEVAGRFLVLLAEGLVDTDRSLVSRVVLGVDR